MDLRWRQQWRTYRILYAKTINSEKLPNELTFIFHSCQIYFWQEFLIFIKLVKIRNLLWKLKIFFYLCVNQVQHRVKRCKSAVGYSVYLKWGQSIKDWYTTEYGKGSFSSLSARTGDGLQIEFATRFVFSPKLCVRRFESCQAVRSLKTSPRTWMHPGRFRGASAWMKLFRMYEPSSGGRFRCFGVDGWGDCRTRFRYPAARFIAKIKYFIVKYFAEKNIIPIFGQW